MKKKITIFNVLEWRFQCKIGKFYFQRISPFYFLFKNYLQSKIDFEIQNVQPQTI